MNPKRIATVVLLAFVAASVAYLVYRETAGAPAPAAGPATAAPAGPETASAAPAQTAVAPRFVAYYFHGTRRCQTCTTMEAFAEEAVRTAFAADLADGRLAWRTVNIEETGNEHFAADFQVTGSTLVVAEFVHGKAVRSQKLDKTWDFVDDRAQFLNYVAMEIEAFVTAAPEAPTAGGRAAGAPIAGDPIAGARR